MQLDHMLITGDIRLRIVALKNQNNRRKRKLDLEKLKNDDTKTDFVVKLRGIEDSMNLQTTLRQIGEETLGYKKCYDREWISEGTWIKIN